ncbi:hypothetical protein SAMN02745704_00351 [Paucidesulfovibrio gracilis DSM 16080]|uniref:Uncharacterized protein n=2 Tax=Paucidesulfovibrio TaxID=2910985 RepID=A0A1T4W509_9BACT|nr:hypothetical protein SAMN02745704_00351 [Paucidesulfovibrio gracilis DSM 16080]
MIPCGNAVAEVLRHAERPGFTGVTLLSYKRDRWVCVRPIHAPSGDSSRFLVEERGFTHQDKTCERRELRGLLKRLVRREFPRSNKLHLRLDKSRINPPV